MAGPVTVNEAVDPADKKAFLDLPYRLYRGDPTWRPPLRFERAEQINPKKNPGLANIESAYWLARRDGEVVGRCASFVNHAHLDAHKDETGHFGFLDVQEDDQDAVGALIKACEDWLRARGMKAIGGPYNFSVNEEIGMLVEGFDTPPVMLMPHGRPDYPGMIEALGFEKAMDLYAYGNNLNEGYPRPAIVTKMQDYVKRSSSITMRKMRKGRFDEEIRTALDIFNDAWSGNWGFVPFGEAQVDHMAGQLKMVIDPEGFWFGEVDGEPVVFVLMIPNLNEATHGLDGRLAPFGWAQLLWRLKVSGVKTARIPLMGARRSVQKKRAGVALMLALFEECYAAMRARGVEWCEMSWVLETNVDVQNMILLSSAERYKTYRMYRKEL
ncbi:MAG: hypothetical protein AAFX03_08305 [Pseudomonadota bacterium]